MDEDGKDGREEVEAVMAAFAIEDRKYIPEHLVQALVNGSRTPEEVFEELERLGWRRVKHLYVVP